MRARASLAIFPIAGLGTRFLPATKSVPKEILTLVDRPLIQYAVDEARSAGIDEFIFVTARGKSALEDYFDLNPTLEASLRKAGKTELLGQLKRTNMDSGKIAYVRQHEARGLGHAVWCARTLIRNKPFAVILPDDLILGDTPCIGDMADAQAESGGNVLAMMEVPAEQASSYGIMDVGATSGRMAAVRGMVEKPAPGTAPSNLAVIGRYILTPAIMRHLARQQRGAGGEVQLTDAIAAELAENPGSVHGYRFAGRRFDCGSKAGFLQATVALALSRPDLGAEFGDFLHRTLDRAPVTAVAQATARPLPPPQHRMHGSAAAR